MCDSTPAKNKQPPPPHKNPPKQTTPKNECPWEMFSLHISVDWDQFLCVH